MVSTVTNLGILKEFNTHTTITGTLETFYSKEKDFRLTKYKRSEFSYYFKLREYPVIFRISRLSKEAFNWEEFKKLKIGTTIYLRVYKDFTATEDMADPSLIWTTDRNFIDAHIRDLKRRQHGWLGLFMSLALTAGLVHHMKKPWI
jgi:hypothetical protein